MSTKRPRWLSTCYHPLLIGSAILLSMFAILLSILYKIFPTVFVLLAKSFPIVVCTVLLLGILLNYGESNVRRAKEEGGTDVRSSIMIKNQDKVTNAVNRRKASGEVEVRDRRAVMTLAEKNNVTQQPGASSDTSSFLLNETKDTCHATADDNELQGFDADPDRHVYESRLNSTNSITSCHDHVHRCRAAVESEHNGDDSSEASEADVMPLFDELDPLLGPETNQAALAASNNSDVGSRDRDSNEDSMAEEAGIQDDEDDEEKEDENKAPVTWTADDQSNLVHLGNSELERNRRLESLIAKRRSRKIPQYRMEKNLIDLDGLDSLPSMEEISRLNAQLSTIYAPRKNPFELPYDADDTIPGSAPSRLLQRQNPFYQAQQQGIGSIGNLGTQEVLAAPSRDPLFRRHESFTIGASLFGDVDQDIFDYRFKPYFSTEREEDERMFAELHRQPSDASDSKVSPVSSDTDQEHQESEPDAKFTAESTDRANESSKEVEFTDEERVLNDINVGDDHETHADNDTSEEQTHQSAQIVASTEDETDEDLEVDSTLSDVGNVKVLDGDHEAHADTDLSVEQSRQSSQILGAAEDETTEDLEVDSAVSYAQNVKVLDDDQETHADKGLSVEEQTHQSDILGEAENETSEGMKVDFLISDAENIKVLGKDNELNSSSLSAKSAEFETEEQPVEKEKMDHVFSHDVVDSVKEVNEESEIVNEEVEQVLPVYDSSPSATEKSKSIFSTVLDETLLSTDKDESLAVVQDPTV